MKTSILSRVGKTFAGILVISTIGCDQSSSSNVSLTMIPPDSKAVVGQPFTLRGTASNLPEGAIVKFAGPGTFRHDRSEAAQAVFIPIEPGEATIEVSVEDKKGKRLTKTTVSLEVLRQLPDQASGLPVAASTGTVANSQQSETTSKERISSRKVITDFSPLTRPQVGGFYDEGQAVADGQIVRDAAENDRGDVLQISYHLIKPGSYAGCYSILPHVEGLGTQWKTLQFKIRPARADGNPPLTRLKLEIKSKGFGWRALYVENLEPEKWQPVTLKLADFRTVRSSFSEETDEIVFTFEMRYVDQKKGLIFVDDLVLTTN